MGSEMCIRDRSHLHSAFVCVIRQTSRPCDAQALDLHGSVQMWWHPKTCPSTSCGTSVCGDVGQEPLTHGDSVQEEWSRSLTFTTPVLANSACVRSASCMSLSMCGQCGQPEAFLFFVTHVCTCTCFELAIKTASTTRE